MSSRRLEGLGGQRVFAGPGMAQRDVPPYARQIRLLARDDPERLGRVAVTSPGGKLPGGVELRPVLDIAGEGGQSIVAAKRPGDASVPLELDKILHRRLVLGFECHAQRQVLTCAEKVP